MNKVSRIWNQLDRFPLPMLSYFSIFLAMPYWFLLGYGVMNLNADPFELSLSHFLVNLILITVVFGGVDFMLLQGIQVVGMGISTLRHRKSPQRRSLLVWAASLMALAFPVAGLYLVEIVARASI